MIQKKKSKTIFMKLTIVCITIVISICFFIGISSIHVTRNTMMKSFASTNSKIVHQIKNNLLRFNEQCTSKINKITQDKSLKKYLLNKPSSTLENYKSRYAISKTLKETIASSEDLNLNFIILGVNDEVYFSDLPTITGQELQELPSTLLSNENRRKIVYRYYNKGFTVGTKDKPVLVMSKALYDYTTSMQYGIVYCIIQEETISDYYDKILSEGNTIVIMDYNAKIVSSNNKALLNTDYSGIFDEMDKKRNEGVKQLNSRFKNEPVTLLYEHIPFFDYFIINIIEEAIVLSDVREITDYIIKICIIMIAITVVVTFVFSHHITKPLTKLVHFMNHFKKDQLSTTLNIKGSYEVEVLNNSFNMMQNQIKEYINKLLVEERERRKAELNALQMQIHPHFLYNTLSSIKYLIYQDDKQKAANTINSLIYLLQNTIGDVNEIICIKQEIENLKHYLVINNSRFGDAISTFFDIDEECNDAKIPKLILQPIVENSFFHAFNGLDKGVINIHVRKKQTNLLCEIIDNGKGMEQLTLDAMFKTNNNKRHFNSVGIKNVDERIKLLYGESYGVTIISEKNCGTSVSIVIPYRTSM